MDKLKVFEELLNCTHCTQIVDEPSESECCGRLYCQTCTSELGYTQCLICYHALKLRKSAFARNLLQKIEFPCKFGCDERFNNIDMKKHQLNCKKKLYKCSIDLCNFTDYRENLITHISDKHPYYILLLLENFDQLSGAFEKLTMTNKTNGVGTIRNGSHNQVSNNNQFVLRAAQNRLQNIDRFSDLYNFDFNMPTNSQVERNTYLERVASNLPGRRHERRDTPTVSHYRGREVFEASDDMEYRRQGIFNQSHEEVVTVGDESQLEIEESMSSNTRYSPINFDYRNFRQLNVNNENSRENSNGLGGDYYNSMSQDDRML